jgi:hypothetical protein
MWCILDQVGGCCGIRCLASTGGGAPREGRCGSGPCGGVDRGNIRAASVTQATRGEGDMDQINIDGGRG